MKRGNLDCIIKNEDLFKVRSVVDLDQGFVDLKVFKNVKNLVKHKIFIEDLIHDIVVIDYFKKMVKNVFYYVHDDVVN